MRKNSVIAWIAALAGLVSWPLAIATLFLIGLGMSKGSDSGWSMMAMGFRALGAVVMVHLAGMLGTVAIWIRRKVHHEPAGKPVIIGLIYYGLLMIVLLTLEGPRELLNDSATVTRSLFQ
jgi:hypothetical protein